MTSEIDLRPTTAMDRAGLRDAFQRYAAEIAPDVPDLGDAYIDRFLAEPDRFAIWICNIGIPVGFALVRRIDSGAYELVEFNIQPAHRRVGIGTTAAHLVFGQLPGRWTLGVASGSAAAAPFWEHCLANCPTIHDIRPGPPNKPNQSKSYSFEIKGTGT